MRWLIVTADDFGITSGMNRGIIQAHRDGILTSTSLMVDRPACEEASALGREWTTLSVGIHLEPSVSQVLSIFGVSQAGAVFVPLNPLLFPEQIVHIANDCRLRGLITSASKRQTRGMTSSTGQRQSNIGMEYQTRRLKADGRTFRRATTTPTKSIAFVMPAVSGAKLTPSD